MSPGISSDVLGETPSHCQPGWGRAGWGSQMCDQMWHPHQRGWEGARVAAAASVPTALGNHLRARLHFCRCDFRGVSVGLTALWLGLRGVLSRGRSPASLIQEGRSVPGGQSGIVGLFRCCQDAAAVSLFSSSVALPQSLLKKWILFNEKARTCSNSGGGIWIPAGFVIPFRSERLYRRQPAARSRRCLVTVMDDTCRCY